MGGDYVINKHNYRKMLPSEKELIHGPARPQIELLFGLVTSFLGSRGQNCSIANPTIKKLITFLFFTHLVITVQVWQNGSFFGFFYYCLFCA
jgi:hypothetical protein